MYKNKFINQIINNFFFYYKSILNAFFFDTVGWRQYVYVRVSMYSHDDNSLNSIFKALIARFVFLIVNFFSLFLTCLDTWLQYKNLCSLCSIRQIALDRWVLNTFPLYYLASNFRSMGKSTISKCNFHF